jgi:hypothetical protein
MCSHVIEIAQGLKGIVLKKEFILPIVQNLLSHYFSLYFCSWFCMISSSM